MSRRYLFTIEERHRHPMTRRDAHERARAITAIGQIMLIDLGKQVFDVGGIVQVENNQQRDKRLQEATQ